MKKIIKKIKDFLSKVKSKIKEAYYFMEKWFGVFILEYKFDFVALFVAAFAFLVDMTAGTRFGSFWALPMIGLLGFSVVERKAQKETIKILQSKKKKK